MGKKVQLPPDQVLLITGFEPPGAEYNTPGGLFVYDGQKVMQLDDKSSSGLCLVKNQFLVRGMRHKERHTTPSDIIVYSAQGSNRFSLPGVANLHDVCWFDDNIVAVSTAQNMLVWVGLDGVIRRRWQAEAEPDSWHLNSLVVDREQLLVSCFGQFTKTREWLQTGLEAGTRDVAEPPATGCLVDTESGAKVIDNLQTPHSPRLIDNSWLLCESLHRSIVQRSANGIELRRKSIGGWTRGLALTDDYIFVGVSRWFARRPSSEPAPPPDETARVVVLDRKSWEQVAVIPLPTLHIYDILVISREILAWIR